MAKIDSRLLVQALVKFAVGIVLIGLLLFIPAGTARYVNGWIFILTFFQPIMFAGLFLLLKSPDLLRKRLDAKEKEGGQKVVVALSGLIFMSAFILAGLDFRFGWTDVPQWLVILCVMTFLMSYLMYAEVMRENEYLSRTIEVQEGQKVIDTGLYGIVRHPMYSATVVMFLSIPLILGSFISFAVMLLYLPVIVFRLINEEKFLEHSLPGYSDYMKKVKYRLIPYIW